MSPNELFEICHNNFKVFVEEIIGFDNQPFHDDIDDAISNPDYKKIAISFPRGHGKAESINSLILTPMGWRKIGDLVVGDEIIGANGMTTTITYLHPVSIMDLYKVETRDGRTALCNQEHLWSVLSPQNSPKYKVKSLYQISIDYKKTRIDKRTGKEFTENKYYIPCPEPVVFNEKNLIVDPYTLGIWLGNGSKDSGSITSIDPEIFNYIPYGVNKNKTKYRYHILGLRKGLSDIGVLKNKEIPEKYLFGSLLQRLGLLQGLMDTDGTCHRTDGTAYFSNTNKDIIDGLVHLVRSLGGIAMVYPKKSTLNGKEFYSWVVSLRLPKGYNPFRLKRKARLYKESKTPIKNAIVNIAFEKREQARCITIANPDGLYITNDFLVTHNSTHLSIMYPLWLIAKNHNLRILLISSSSLTSKSFLTEIMGHIEKNELYQAYAKWEDERRVGVVPKMRQYRKTQENWSGDSIIIDREDLKIKDPTIHALGVFGSILSKRADIIICDDVVNQENSATEEQRRKVIDWIYTTIMPVLVPGGKFLYLGNTWHQEDLVAHLLRDPLFDYRDRMPAIIKESDHPELWDIWTQILLDESLTVENRKKKAEEYYQENKELMDSGAEVLWGSRFPYKELVLLRLSNSYAFSRMYQCLKPETLVRTATGLKKIKDIRVGDRVLTAVGRLRPVLKTIQSKRKGKIYAIKVQGFYDTIYITGEHPVLTKDGWKNASELTTNDFVISAQQKGDNSFSVGVNRPCIYGWYLAEGSIGVHGRQVTFSLSTKEKGNIKSLIQALESEGFSYTVRSMRNEPSCTNIKVNSKSLADELIHLFGRAKNKHINEVIFDMPEVERKILLDSYLLGDGHKEKNCINASSVCLNLSDGIARIAESLGYSVTKRYYRTRKNSIIDGRTIKTNGYDHQIRIYQREGFSHIQEIKIKYYYGNLYNLEVSEDNSYSLAHFIVHNCDPSNRPDQKFKEEWLERAIEKGQDLKLQDEPRTEFDTEIVTEGLDLAISMEDTADDTCKLTLDRVRFGNDKYKKGDYIIRQIKRGKMTPNETRLMVKTDNGFIQPAGIRVESVAYQQSMVRDLEDMGIPVHGYHTGGEKFNSDIGVNSLAIIAEIGKLIIPYSSKDPRTVTLCSKLVNEMRSFPDGHTGDSLMALWFAFSEMRDLEGKRIMIPTFEHKPEPDMKNKRIIEIEERRVDLALTAEQMIEKEQFNKLMRQRFQ